jgi:hypothetical protein
MSPLTFVVLVTVVGLCLPRTSSAAKASVRLHNFGEIALWGGEEHERDVYGVVVPQQDGDRGNDGSDGGGVGEEVAGLVVDIVNTPVVVGPSPLIIYADSMTPESMPKGLHEIVFPCMLAGGGHCKLLVDTTAVEERPPLEAAVGFQVAQEGEVPKVHMHTYTATYTYIYTYRYDTSHPLSVSNPPSLDIIAP